MTSLYKQIDETFKAIKLDLRQRAKARGDVDSDGIVILDIGNGTLHKINKALTALREAKQDAKSDVKELREALSDADERYQDAIKYYEGNAKNFYGMNKDRPKKSEMLIIFEGAKRHLEFWGTNE